MNLTSFTMSPPSSTRYPERPATPVLRAWEIDGVAAYLRAVYEQRRSRNARYSLRTYSRALGLAQSMLVRLLRGERRLSPDRWHAVGASLGLTPEEREYLLAVDEALESRGKVAAEVRALRLRRAAQSDAVPAPVREGEGEALTIALDESALVEAREILAEAADRLAALSLRVSPGAAVFRWTNALRKA